MVLQKVLMEKTLSPLWKKLETLYATKSLANRLVLKQHLFMFHMNEGELLRDHISQFITLLNDLKNVEVQIDNEDQTMLLLCSLPLLYNRDKLDNEFDLDSKADRQAFIFVALKKRDKRCHYWLLRVTRKMQLVLIWLTKAVMISC
ncbi:hypothetical protein Gotur_023419 [Gossypium turneri]